MHVLCFFYFVSPYLFPCLFLLVLFLSCLHPHSILCGEIKSNLLTLLILIHMTIDPADVLAVLCGVGDGGVQLVHLERMLESLCWLRI